jgi:phosphoheptose isomerase
MPDLQKKQLNKKKKYFFFENYKNSFSKSILDLNIKKIAEIANLIEKIIINKRKIFVAGNGGSAAVANHFLCDFNKGIKISSQKKLLPRVISLSNSIELITAISNDLSFEEIFSSQLENYAEKEDCLVAISCSGTSKNIINLIKLCKKKKMKIIYFTGFLDKKPIIKVDHHLNINIKNYGISEDIFSSIMHMISQYLRSKYSIKKETL